MFQRTSIQRRKQRRSDSLLPLLITGTVSLLSGLFLFSWYVQLQKDKIVYPVEIGAEGMEPCLMKGDVIMTEGRSLQDTLPGRGEVIVFVTDDVPQLFDEKKGTFVVQRIAAIEDDEVELLPGKVLVNGREFTTKTATAIVHYDGAQHRGVRDHFTVPRGHVFTLGDNTAVSSDGRMWGYLPVRNILYRAWFCYWPPQHAGMVR